MMLQSAVAISIPVTIAIDKMFTVPYSCLGLEF